MILFPFSPYNKRLVKVTDETIVIGGKAYKSDVIFKIIIYQNGKDINLETHHNLDEPFKIRVTSYDYHRFKDEINDWCKNMIFH